MYRISKPHIIKQQKIKQVVLDAVNTYQTAGASAFIKNAPDVSLTSKAYIDYNNNAQVYYNLGASGVAWSTVSDNPKLEFTLRKLGEKTAKEFFDAGYMDTYADTKVKNEYSNFQNTTDSTKNSTEPSKRIAKNRKSRYDEFNTLAMQWAYSNKTNVGDTKVFNKNGKNYVLIEATEDGYIEIASGNYEKVSDIYGRIYNEATEYSLWSFKENRSSKRGNIRNNAHTGNSRNRDDGTNGRRTSDRTGQKELSDYPTRNTKPVHSDIEKTSAKVKIERTQGKFTNKTDNAQLDEVFSKLADKLHIDITYQKGSKNSNGSFVASKGQATINEGAKRGDMTTVMHECVGEYMRAYSPTEYKQLSDSLITWLAAEHPELTQKDIINYYNTYLRSEPLTTMQDARFEMTNDLLGALFESEDGLTDFCQWLETDKNTTVKQKKTILEQLKELIQKAVERLKEYFNKEKFTDTQKAVSEMELKQAQQFRQQCLAILDHAISNLENGVEIQGGKVYSKKLGKFADVNINFEDELNYYGIPNTARVLNDYVGVQKSVLSKLKADNFFNKNNNIVVNADTDIVVEITPNGIRETLSSNKRYASLPRIIKEAKLATIRNLPDMIKYAEVKELNQSNYHKNKMISYLVLEHPCTVNGSNFNVEIKIRKTPQGNKFYIHNLKLKQTYSTWETDAEISDTRSLKSRNMSKNNISQDDNNVKRFSRDIDRAGNLIPTSNEDIRYSRDVDEFDAEDYTYPRLAKKEYNRLRREALAFNADKVNKIVTQNLDNGYKYAYYFDDEYNLIVLGKTKSTNIHERYKDAKRVANGFTERFNNAESERGNLRGSNIVSENRRTDKSILSNVNNNIQKERKSDRRGNAQNGYHDNLSEEKRYSIDIDKYDTRSLIKQNKQLQKSVEYYKMMLGYNSGHKVSRNKIRSYALQLKKQWNTALSTDDIADSLAEIFDFISSGNATWDSIESMGNALGKEIVYNIKQEIDSENQAVLDDLKQYTVSIDSHQRDEITYYYGGVGALTKKCE